MKTYQKIAREFDRYFRNLTTDNTEWVADAESQIEELCKNHLPSGSGIDCGTKFDFDSSRPERLVFICEYHHMDEWGSYDGWTTHSVILTPSLSFGFSLRITGRDRNQIKEYLADTYYEAFNEEVAEL
jgi:hypothetical protein